MAADDLGDRAERVAGDAADALGPLDRELGVVVEQGLLDRLEHLRQVGSDLGEERLPVDPSAHELALPRAVLR